MSISTPLAEWKPFNRVSNAQKIVDGLKLIPDHWSLTPLQDKSPKRSNWQTEDFIPHAEITKLILQGEHKVSQKGNPYTAYSSGFGLRTGEASGGLLAIDVDGASAQPLLEAISGGDIPLTVSWTSGKPGRYQLLFQVPDDIRPLLKDFNRAVLTEWEGLQTARDADGKPTELLEFRYNRSQSCLPPSRHPTTGSYRWATSPQDIVVATAPHWLCELIIKFANQEIEQKRQREERAIRWTEFQQQGQIKDGAVSFVDFLEFQVLPLLLPEQVFNWPGHNFKQYGKTLKGVPPWRQSASGTSFHVWLDSSGRLAWQDKGTGEGGNAVEYRWRLRGGTGTPKGKDFVSVVEELARDAGLTLPELPKTEVKSKNDNLIRDDWQLQQRLRKTEVKSKNDDSRGQGFGQQNESKGYITKIRKSPDWSNWIDKNKFTPDITLNCDGDLVLPDELMNIENINLLINSGLGTGKTLLALMLIKLLESVYNPFTGYTGIYTTILGYINSLLHQTIERAREYGVDILHVQSDDDGKLLAKDTNSHIASCVHSLPHSDGHFSGKAVMIDEGESVLMALVTGSNLGSKHGEIIEMFSRAINASYGNIFLDGNMTDLSADLIEKISGKKNIKVLNHGQIRRKNFKFIISAKKGKNGKIKVAVNDPSPLIKMILDDIRKGKKAFVTTDSRIFGESLAENAINITSDERSVKQLADVAEKEGYKVFVISKNTSGTDEGKAFLSNPGEYIAKNNISLVIGTPSIGSGVSIQLPEGFEDHFDAQATLFCGVLSTKQQKQLLARLRNNKLIHYVYCPIKSLVKDRNRPQQYSATEYLREINERQRLNRAISYEQIQQLHDDAKSRINPIFDRYSAELGALDNFEQDNLLECLSYSLESEGHGVECVYLDPDEQSKNEMKEAKERIRTREAVEFEKSIPFDSTLEADNLVKANPTPENHLRRDKTYFVKERLPGIENTEVWGVELIREFVIDDRQQYKVKAITREWLLGHPEIAFENHNIKTIRKLEKRYVTSKDLLPGDYGKIWALKELKFKERVLDAEQFTCKSPNIQELVKEYTERKDLQKLLKIEPPKDKVKDTTIQDLIRPMLELVGKKTEEQGRIRVDGISRTLYKAVSAIEEKSRAAIYGCLTDKFTKEYEKRELDKMLESLKTQQELTEQIKNQQSTVNSHEENMNQQTTVNAQQPLDEKWFTPENLQITAGYLDDCEDPEMLADLREKIKIPAPVLVVASRLLSQEKRELIRQWVVAA